MQRPDAVQHGIICRCQSPCFEVDHRDAWELRRRTEIMPVKDSHTRINSPLVLLANYPILIHPLGVQAV
jgi:hypothetical protein